MIQNRAQQIVAGLELAWPKWHVWVVHHAVGGVTWCAHLRADERTVINADSPRELQRMLMKQEGS